MWPNLLKSTHLVTLTKEILKGELKFLCSENCLKKRIATHMLKTKG